MTRNLLEPRQRTEPTEYPQFKEAWKKAVTSPWHHYEIAMLDDVTDWNSDKLSDADRAAIAGILRGFTIMEQRIGCYWRDVVAKYFPKPEIQNMASAFSSQESIHLYSYNHLEETLGLDTYEAFLEDETALAKLAHYFVRSDNLDKENYSRLATSLAVFSGAGEGLSLFGSFAILLDFCRRGILNGVKQILSYSLRDEALHSKMGIDLYRQFIEENPDAKPSDEYLITMMDARLQCELEFVKNAFNVGDSIGVSLEEVEIFLNHRKAKILQDLGVVYPTPLENDKIGEWFYPLAFGSTLQDFFTSGRNGSAYATTLTQDFNAINYSELLQS